jgi:hypothetical protein
MAKVLNEDEVIRAYLAAFYVELEELLVRSGARGGDLGLSIAGQRAVFENVAVALTSAAARIRRDAPSQANRAARRLRSGPGG